MILVTGFIRSGTSLAMQTLFHLGYPIYGEPYPKEIPPGITQPGGKPFWESRPTVLTGDVAEARKNNWAVKVMIVPAMAHINLDPARDKIIFTKRSPEKLVAAWAPFYESGAMCPKVMCRDFIRDTYTKFQYWSSGVPTLVLGVDDMRADPERGVLAIREFVGSDADPTEAVRNVTL